jgi:hypothetical protein
MPCRRPTRAIRDAGGHRARGLRAVAAILAIRPVRCDLARPVRGRSTHQPVEKLASLQAMPGLLGFRPARRQRRCRDVARRVGPRAKLCPRSTALTSMPPPAWARSLRPYDEPKTDEDGPSEHIRILSPVHVLWAGRVSSHLKPPDGGTARVVSWGSVVLVRRRLRLRCRRRRRGRCGPACLPRPTLVLPRRRQDEH